MTVYDVIESNKRKTIFFIVLIPLIRAGLYFCISTIAKILVNSIGIAEIYRDYINRLPQNTIKILLTNPRLHLPISMTLIMLINIIWILLKFQLSAEFTIKNLDVQDITYTEYPIIYNMIQHISTVAGILPPKGFILNSKNMNAFAAGSDPNNSVVVLTRGLVKLLTKDELEGVIAHEIAHIKNQDTRLMMALIYSGAMYGIIAEFIYNIIIRSSGRISIVSKYKKEKGSILTPAIIFIFFIMIFAHIIYYILYHYTFYKTFHKHKKRISSRFNSCFIYKTPRCTS